MMEKIRVLELFAGIGACSKALERLKIPHEIVDAVEIDKYAIRSFNAIHNTNFEPQDIREWDKDLKVDLIIHGSPCQDFSIAGKQAGGDMGSGTRSSLMYDTLRIVKKLRPKYVIWENVKNLLSQKHRPNFDAYQEQMVELGYRNFYQVLNAKDYGIPQNRERVFTVSILDDDNFSFPSKQTDGKINKVFDINKEVLNDNERQRRVYSPDGISPALLNRSDSPKIITKFDFPPQQELSMQLNDILDEQVEEKYYLDQKMIDDFRIKHSIKQSKSGISVAGELNIKTSEQVRKVYSCDGVAPTLDTMGGGHRQPKIIIDDTQGFDGVRYYCEYAPTLRAGRSGLKTTDRTYRIRKLTPKECWRLMGFDDTDFEKASRINSNTQLYKQAGNSIVVNVLMAILSELFNEGSNE